MALPPGTIGVNTIIMARTVKLRGATGGTTLSCNTSPCIEGPVDGNQMYRSAILDLTLQPASSGLANGVVLSLPTLEQSEIGRLEINGFTGGTWLSLGGANPTVITDTNLGGNIIWNNFHDVFVNGCGTCAILQGHYSAGSGLNGSAPAPDQLVTQNTFNNINEFFVNTKGWSIVNSTDTNTWFGGLVQFNSNGATGVVQGDDPNYTAITYTNSNKFFGIAFSKNYNVTRVTLFGTQNFTYGLEAYGMETDIDPTLPGITVITQAHDGGSGYQSFHLCGHNLVGNINFTLGCYDRGISGHLSNVIGLTEGGAVVSPIGYDKIVLSGSGTLNAATITLPCNPQNDQRIGYGTTALTVSSLTVAGCNAQTDAVYGSPGTISPQTPFAYRAVVGGGFVSWVRD